MFPGWCCFPEAFQVVSIHVDCYLPPNIEYRLADFSKKLLTFRLQNLPLLVVTSVFGKFILASAPVHLSYLHIVFFRLHFQ